MVTLNQIREARTRIQSSVYCTPILHASYRDLDHRKIFLKMENFQMTGSFKERGAANKLLKMNLDRQSGPCEIIAASAGNHSQAVSLHGTKLGCKVSIVMPRATPLNKITATERWGGNVTLHGELFHESLELAKTWVKARNAIFVHAYDDPDVIAGQGTIGLEVLEQMPKVDTIIVPVGGGGLAAGIATAIKESKPSCKVIGVAAQACPRVYAAVKDVAFQPDQIVSTIAEGIAVKSIGQYTVPLMKKYLDDMVLVSEESIAKAVMILLESSKIIAEGAAATSLSTLLEGKVKITDNTLCIVSGGNIDVSLVSRIIEKGLLQSHRLMHLEVRVADRPGGLNTLTTVLANLGANIRNIYHERAFADLGLDQTGTDLILEIRGEKHKQAILDVLKKHKFVFKLRE